MNRFEIQTSRQFAIIPTFGIIWGLRWWKWAIAFNWLNIQCRIAFSKKKKDRSWGI